MVARGCGWCGGVGGVRGRGKIKSELVQESSAAKGDTIVRGREASIGESGTDGAIVEWRGLEENVPCHILCILGSSEVCVRWGPEGERDEAAKRSGGQKSAGRKEKTRSRIHNCKLEC